MVNLHNLIPIFELYITSTQRYEWTPKIHIINEIGQCAHNIDTVLSSVVTTIERAYAITKKEIACSL